MAESRILPTVGALSGTEELCKHFCKTGKCKHDVHCRYVHDRSKVRLFEYILIHPLGFAVSTFPSRRVLKTC